LHTDPSALNCVGLTERRCCANGKPLEGGPSSNQRRGQVAVLKATSKSQESSWPRCKVRISPQLPTKRKAMSQNPAKTLPPAGPRTRCLSAGWRHRQPPTPETGDSGAVAGSGAVTQSKGRVDVERHRADCLKNGAPREVSRRRHVERCRLRQRRIPPSADQSAPKGRRSICDILAFGKSNRCEIRTRIRIEPR